MTQTQLVPAVAAAPPLTLATALEIIGGLSEPGKMPGYGWSTPAKACITGTKLRSAPNSVCSSCYAMKGRYNFPRVQNALRRRLEAVKDPRFVSAFIFALTAKYRRLKGEDRFRHFDSGDISSLDHLIKINQIALGTPYLRHWLPTREFGIVKQFQASGRKFAPNLIVRMSFPFIGGRATKSDLPQSTVGRDSDTDLHQCPASHQGNQCLSCDACWTTKSINYVRH